MKLEEKLVSLRRTKGWSQLKLAEMMNVSRQAVSRWEVGKAVPSIDNLKSLGQLYGVPLEYLIHDDFPEPICEDQGLTRKESNAKREKRGNRTVVLIFIIVVVLSVIFGVIFFHYKGKEQDQVLMNDIEGGEIITEDDFELGL